MASSDAIWFKFVVTSILKDLLSCLSLLTSGRLPGMIYLKPSYFSGTLILTIFVGKGLVYFYFSDFHENW